LANFRDGDEETAQQLMNRADAAMYTAKAASRSAVSSF
jgi:GGDEF domain-containing protein